MYLESDIGLGAMAPSNVQVGVTVVNGVQQLSAAASGSLLTLFSGRSPQISSSFTIATGSAAPGYDQAADLWSYLAASAPPGPGASVYDQLQTLAPGAIAYVDLNSAQDVISGKTGDVTYAIGKDAKAASYFAGPGASLAVLNTSPANAGTTEAPKKNMVAPIAGLVVGAGAGALLAGGIGAIAGGVAGYLVGNAVA